jgi:hypothetical protein
MKICVKRYGALFFCRLSFIQKIQNEFFQDAHGKARFSQN